MKTILFNASVCGCLTLAAVSGCTKSESTAPATALVGELMMTQAAASLPRTSQKPVQTTLAKVSAESTSPIEVQADQATVDLLELAPESETPTPKQSPRTVTARVPSDQELKILLDRLQAYRPTDSK